ncbi:MAG TPA: sialidase family protein, partial [Thermodesulfobacteriota bacterium]|nr:sialidase family protein [Thermodesulfobacteriota bacterium]
PDLPGMAVNGRGDAALVWEDSTAVRRSIYLRMSRDGGKTFGESAVLSKAVKSFAPDIAAAPDGGFVVARHEERFPSVVTVIQYIRPDS